MRNLRWAAKDFVAADVQAKTIDSNLAPGVELAAGEGGELTIKQAARLECARKIAIECQYLAGAASRNLMIATKTAIPKASHGWFCGTTSEATFRQADRAIAQVGPDPNLKTLPLDTRPQPSSCRGYSW